MMMPNFNEPVQKYSTAKKIQFNKTKERVRLILESIRQTSLKAEDKTKLLNEVKKLVADF